VRVRIEANWKVTVLEGDVEIGKVYYLEDASCGTTAQNKAFHALVAEYYKSGCGSYEAKSYDYFRDSIKRSLGEGFECILWSKTPIYRANSFKDVPEHIRKRKNFVDYMIGKLKSWTDYSKKQRRETMDKLISEMHQTGVQTKKFHEILDGMGDLWH